LIFEKVKSEGLAHNSYFIASQGEAVVIDPRRDCEIYVELAQREEARIKYILETHRNEDYAVGSIELNYLTGAEVFHGSGLNWKYGKLLKEKQEFQFGSLKLTALLTPGHTDESVSYVLKDLSLGDAPIMVFTGDALFAGEVGRTDLYGPEEAPRLAASLYESIFNKILPLGDEVLLYPAHGGGSICGKNIIDRGQSTLGLERKHNSILQVKGKEAFVKWKLEEKHEVPPYFRQMERYNLDGPPLLKTLPRPSVLAPEEFKEKTDEGAVIVDTRDPTAFGAAHIKGSYSIWLEGLPIFAGWILPYDRPLLLVLEDSLYLERAVRYLIRLGYDKIAGYLRGGFENRGAGIEDWYSSGLPVEHLNLLSVHELKRKIDLAEDVLVLDVRSDEEWSEGHIEGTLHIYVGHLEDRLSEVPRDKDVCVLCSIGNRGSLGASILLRARYSRVSNILAGMTAWKANNYPTSSQLQL